MVWYAYTACLVMYEMRFSKLGMLKHEQYYRPVVIHHRLHEIRYKIRRVDVANTKLRAQREVAWIATLSLSVCISLPVI